MAVGVTNIPSGKAQEYYEKKENEYMQVEPLSTGTGMIISVVGAVVKNSYITNGLLFN